MPPDSCGLAGPCMNALEDVCFGDNYGRSHCLVNMESMLRGGNWAYFVQLQSMGEVP